MFGKLFHFVSFLEENKTQFLSQDNSGNHERFLLGINEIIFQTIETHSGFFYFLFSFLENIKHDF